MVLRALRPLSPHANALALNRLRTLTAHARQSNRKHVEQANERGRVPVGIWSKCGANLHLRKNHPLCILREEIETYFEQIAPNEFSFNNNLSPVVTTHDCFDSLLVPKDHVSRAESDTYYVDDDHVLRAHMTAHDVRLMRSGLRAFVNCGDVYRRDTVDRTHYPVFHQIDGVKIFEDAVSDSVVEDDLKNTLQGLAKRLFGDVQYRWVDAYFPFTHPSWELEVHWRGEWLELLGCGQVHRGVLRNGGIADDRTGWAFGLGLERVAMVLFGIPDIRLFWSEDERFLSQFEANGLHTKYKEFSIYPGVKKDISFWVNDAASFHVNHVHEIVRLIADDIVEDVQVVDRFEKDGRESLCFRIVFRSMERSLTHDEVNELLKRIIADIQKRLNVTIR